MKKSLIYILISILLISTVFAEDVNVYFFYGDGCPHCAEAEPFLEKMVEKYPDVNLHSYETWKNTDNSDLFIKMSSACGTDVIGVPTIFIGHEAIIGYDNDENKGREIEEAIINYDGVDLMKNIGDNLTTCPNDKKDIDTVITLPLIGTIDTTRISLPLFTIIIGLLDGFNPCAMWVLMFLLTLLVYTKSRKRMFMIGGTFILISGLVYYFFMAAWLNLYLIIEANLKPYMD